MKHIFTFQVKQYNSTGCANTLHVNKPAKAMSPFTARSVRFDPTDPKHLDYYAVSYEGFTVTLEYVESIDALRVVITTPEGQEMTRPQFWNKWDPSKAVDDTFQREVLALISYRKLQAA